MNAEPPTKVIFRKLEKEVVALFPEEPSSVSTWYWCSSYSHVGQHASADPEGVVAMSRPARQEEYLPLMRELEQRGYNLYVRHRISPEMRAKRERQWKAWQSIGSEVGNV